jgi:ribosome-associated toxin RatA of RatAB toxin-antitoxin module
MHIVERSALVNHPAEYLYDLVEDISAYPDFLPWCAGAEVRREGPSLTEATLHIGYRGLRQKFSTRNINTPRERIEMRLLSGPFKHLNGIWQFSTLSPEASKVHLRLEYQISSALLEHVLGPVFEQIANTFVDAFVRRADALRVAK